MNKSASSVTSRFKNYLGRIELTQQPEKTFYKDEGGYKWCYLFVFFCVRAARTETLKALMDQVEDGRRKIKVSCQLLHEDGKPVDDSSMLILLGSSRPETQELADTEPEFDPVTFTGSVRYRIQKVSMRSENRGFRLKISLHSLEDVIEPAVTEPSMVLSKRKLLRKRDRLPEQQIRLLIEDAARERNFEVEKKLARCAPTVTPLIHELGGANSGFTEVPEFPGLRKSVEEFDEDGFTTFRAEKRPKRTLYGSAVASGAIDETVDHLNQTVSELTGRVNMLESYLKGIETIILSSIPGGYAPTGNTAGVSGKGRKQYSSDPVPSPFGQSSFANSPGDTMAAFQNQLSVWDSFSKNLSNLFKMTQGAPGGDRNLTTSLIDLAIGNSQDKAAPAIVNSGGIGPSKGKRGKNSKDA